jgi:hypothetical protein
MPGFGSTGPLEIHNFFSNRKNERRGGLPPPRRSFFQPHPLQ